MPELENAVHALKSLNWSEYESKTFAALIFLGKSTASQITKKSNIPANRTYQILEKLIGKGCVKRYSGYGKPALFEAEDPHKVFDKWLGEQANLVNKIKEELDQLQERHGDKDNLRTYTIMGRRDLNNHLSELVNNSDKSIKIYVDTLTEIRYAKLIEALNDKKEDTEISLLTTERGINDKYEKEVYNQLKSVEFLITNDHFASILFIGDEKSLIFVNIGLPKDSDDQKDYFGVYLEDKKSLEMFTSMFDRAWENGLQPPLLRE